MEPTTTTTNDVAQQCDRGDCHHPHHKLAAMADEMREMARRIAGCVFDGEASTGAEMARKLSQWLKTEAFINDTGNE